MKAFFCGIIIAVALSAKLASADTHVRGYYKKDGTYVAPYERTDANGTTSDNYSHKGNVNPYTGQPGDKTN